MYCEGAVQFAVRLYLQRWMDEQERHTENQISLKLYGDLLAREQPDDEDIPDGYGAAA